MPTKISVDISVIEIKGLVETIPETSKPVSLLNNLPSSLFPTVDILPSLACFVSLLSSFDCLTISASNIGIIRNALAG